MILWYVGLVVIIGCASFAAFHFGHSTVGFLIIMIPVALIANGFLAEYEDNAPGGFNHPNAKNEDDGVKKAELNKTTTANDLHAD